MNQTRPNWNTLPRLGGGRPALRSVLATLALTAALGGLLAQPLVAQRPDAASRLASRETPPAADPAMADAATATDGKLLLEESVRRINAQSSVYAKLRHRVSLYGHEIQGTGEYWQQRPRRTGVPGSADAMQVRMELKMPLGDSIASLTQVCDGRHLWIRRALDDETPPQLRRVDLRKVRSAATDVEARQWRDLMVGGLPRLLMSLRAQYEFAPPVAANYSSLRVWRLRGTQSASGQGTPRDQRPSHVELVIDRGELRFPLRITYLASSDGESGPQLRPLVGLELYDVRLGARFDRSRFEYQAESYDDTTGQFIKRLRRQPSEPDQEDPTVR